MHHDVIMAGFGGQGILMIGNVLAMAGIQQGFRVTFFPSYGVEMRGGTANCTVTVADREIGSPVTSRPLGVIAMNEPSAAKFGPWIRDGGFLVLNSSLIPETVDGLGALEVFRVPCNELALELGDARVASMVALGAYVAATGLVKPESIEAALPDVLPERAHKLIPLNLRAAAAGGNHVAKAVPA
jgi:2-oxoglutarate ferredoxin oxidoreductase subunit gamma